MLPELIRMACTAYGAWGNATGGKGLTQVRALDFGGGPFANYTVRYLYVLLVVFVALLQHLHSS